MKTKEQTKIELERWLNRKADIDMHNTINRPDQFKRHPSIDIFDEYTEDDDGDLRADLWAMGSSGVYDDEG